MKVLTNILFTLSFSFLFSFKLNAQEITGAWIRKPNPAVPMTAAFFKIKNNTKEDLVLEKVSGKDAKNYEIHTHKKVDGVMKMRQIHSLTIKAGEVHELKPMHDHIMFIQIKKGALQGKVGEFTLHFKGGKETLIKAPVKKMPSSPPTK